MAKLLSGNEVVAALTEQFQKKVAELKKNGVTPTLAIIRVGRKGNDISYERGARKRCKEAGVTVKKLALQEDTTQQELLDLIDLINRDDSIHGILLFRPLPAHMDEKAIRNAIIPSKDVDGLTDSSLAGVFAGAVLGFPPCTPMACMEVLGHYNIDVKGKNVVIVGASLVVGKPVSMVLLDKEATVTICHEETRDVPALCRTADILIVAAGCAGLVDRTYLSPGQIVLDVGINTDASGKICGDVNFAQAEDVVGAITPVPGGIGTVTTSVLVKHVIEAASRNLAAA
jgi:5,10-methylene-tetrahydrofolate dehydrogenase/Methenyl tetrahydrofolate cyclohydrolase